MRYEDKHEAKTVEFLNLDVARLTDGRLTLQLGQVLSKEQELLLKQLVKFIDGNLCV